MTPSQIRALLETLIPAREPVLLVGPPGIGKSDVASDVAASLGYDLIITHPVVEDPTDYKGMPAVVHGDGGPTASFLPFGELNRMLSATVPTVVMMDDLGQAPPAVQAAVMQLILARQINGRRISDHVSFIAATNRREDKAAVTGFIAPLLDRFTCVVPMEFNLDEWVRWGIQNRMPVELLAFARLQPTAILGYQKDPDGASGGDERRPAPRGGKEMRKSPTPRSVAGLGRLVNLGVLDLDTLAGAAGEAFATAFLAFHATWSEIPDRNEIYLNPDSVPVPVRPDVLYALMGSLAFAANPVNFDQTVRYLARVPAEYSVACVKDAVARHRELTKTQAFIRWNIDHAAAFGFDAAA
jgi:hypothetical protein